MSTFSLLCVLVFIFARVVTFLLCFISEFVFVPSIYAIYFYLVRPRVSFR